MVVQKDFGKLSPDNFSPNFPDNLAEDESPWEICYTSGLTDDVFGRLNDPEVDAVLRQINNP